jgi:tRNA (mo5U34)-methyltransferase
MSEGLRGAVKGALSIQKRRIEREMRSVPYWWHSIKLRDDVVTPGHKSPGLLQAELDELRLPPLEGKSVLDIGAWDGFYSFAAERLGASRVVALDHYMWSMDLEAWERVRDEYSAQGKAVPPPQRAQGVWKPEELPGKRGFDVARAALGSSVEPVVADFMRVDPAELGHFDVVLFLGVIYHMENPLEALRQVFRLARELAVIEFEAIATPGLEGRAICEFLSADQLNRDPTNWWIPNRAAIEAMCEAAGFRRVESWEMEAVQGFEEPDGLRRLRAAAHAWK